MNNIRRQSGESKSSEKIPRIIHYCWFGQKPMPLLAKKCIKSWKSKLPDYKIIRWDEDSFDINSHVYTKEAYAAKNGHLSLIM
jgi:mannosyltransferase OCH1-like enzyme